MQYTPYLRWGIIVGLFAIPFVSLLVATGGLVPSMFFPYITGKNFAFRILVEILLGLYVLLALRDPRYRPRSSLIMWAVLAFVLWMGVATFFSVDPQKSFWSNFERMEGYVALLHSFVYFLIAGAVLTVERLWERFFQTFVGVSVLQGLLALFQVLHWFGFTPSSQSGVRADGTFGNATYLAVFLLINFFLTLYLLMRHWGERRLSAGAQVVYGCALVIQGVGVFFSQTRGAMLGLVGGLVVMALYLLWQAKGPEARTVRRFALGALGALVIFAGTIFLFKDTAFIKEIPGVSRLATLSLQERTVASRFSYIWPMALKGAMERPLSGWGQENFNFVFNKYYDPGMYDQEEWFDRAHNQFLDWLIAGGVPAFLLYLSFYLLVAWAIFRSALRPPEQAALLGLLAAFGFNNSFVFDNLMSAVCFFTVLGFAHSLSRNELPGWMFLVKPVGDRALAVAAPVVIVLVALSLYQFNAAGMARAQGLLKAIQPSSDLSASSEAFKAILGDDSLGEQETVEQFLQFASVVSGASGVSPELKEEIRALAKERAEEFIAQRPEDTRMELLYASFLAQSGQLNESLTHLQKALASSPKKQRVFFQLGLLFLQEGDVEQAISYFKQGYDLEPRSGLARVFYASGLYYAGRAQEADALLEERYGTTIVDDPRLLQVYSDTKQYGRVVGIWQLRIAETPNDPQLHIGLATAYFTAGDNDGAIAELERAAQLDTSLAPQIRSIIGQIRDGTLTP